MSINVQVEGAMALLTIDREKQLNALNRQTLMELDKGIAAIRDDANIKSVVITGAGNKAFVAGADIAEMKDMTEDQAQEFSALGQRVFASLESLPQPVIAAVNGYALGGGCELALACDLRFAGDWAKFGQPEISLGIIPGFGGTQRLTRLVGRGRAFEMILGGKPIDAQAALDLGLVEGVYTQEELMPRAVKFARQLSGYSLRALAAVKSAFNSGLSDGFQREQELFAQLFAGKDQKEGMTAFLERRPPKFTE